MTKTNATSRLMQILAEKGGYAAGSDTCGARGQIWAYSNLCPDGVRFKYATLKPLIENGTVQIRWLSARTAQYTLA